MCLCSVLFAVLWMHCSFVDALQFCGCISWLQLNLRLFTSCEVIKDRKTNESLCYAFIEFSSQEECEAAYFKMNNVLIDDRRILVDFSQSVSKMKGVTRCLVQSYCACVAIVSLLISIHCTGGFSTAFAHFSNRGNKNRTLEDDKLRMKKSSDNGYVYLY